MKLTLKQIADAVNGKLSGAEPEAIITSVSADSRSVKPGGLFIAINNGHDHIKEALGAGAACALSQRDIAGLPVIRVEDTQKALRELAKYYRRMHNVKIVAVTGSVGKTSTKDMIASVLAQKYVTLKTPGNKNNLIGLPLTLLTLDESHDAVVLEMGMNHFGEIHELSLLAEPDVCVITNIGDSHIEYLGSREGILQAKLEIVDGMKPGGTLVLNSDDPMLTGLRGKYPDAVYCTAACGNAAGDMNAPFNKDAALSVYASDVKSLGLEGMVFRLHLNRKGHPHWDAPTSDTTQNGRSHRDATKESASQEVRMTSPGMHTVTNALLAAAVGAVFGLSIDQIAAGLEAYTPTGRRFEIHNVHDMRVIDDAYNANPASVKAAVDILAGMTEAARRVCVLGDMFELGEHAERLHRETGEYIANSSIDLVIAIGDNARYYIKDIPILSHWFKDNVSFIEKWQEFLKPGDAVLVKASNGMRFNEIIFAITQGVMA
jgi:UDP-N-acetylmuramoyl-tripeptide--D-alanyl-D-alanine ligase